MRIAFLIMAHKDPDQLARLVDRLNFPGFDCYIHLDKKVDSAPFLSLGQKENVTLIRNRTRADWAAFSFTAAIYRSLEEVINTGVGYDFIQVMSGQDYPIVSNRHIHRFFEEHAGRNFISFETEESGWWKHAIGRIRNYHLTAFRFPGRYKVQTLLNALLPERKFPLPYTLYGGPRASWFTVSHACATYVVNFMNSHPELRRFCTFTWGSDEFLFQTIIMNSPYKDSVVNDAINYIDWSGGGANPKILTVDDFNTLRNSGRYFARKFDPAKDARILDMLDEAAADAHPNP
jgi:hypothetical protein